LKNVCRNCGIAGHTVSHCTKPVSRSKSELINTRTITNPSTRTITNPSTRTITNPSPSTKTITDSLYFCTPSTPYEIKPIKTPIEGVSYANMAAKPFVKPLEKPLLIRRTSEKKPLLVRNSYINADFQSDVEIEQWDNEAAENDNNRWYNEAENDNNRWYNEAENEDYNY
jgi:hypothetical protein